jgi:two-component system CheB/CheR fusion protein
VDDNPDAAESLGMLLDMIGFAAEVCLDPDSAIERFEGFHPEACVLDVGLPRMSGCDLAKILRERARSNGRNLYLIAVTAHNDRNTKRRTAEAGFDLHMTKPVEPQALIDALFQFERCVRTSAAVG